jgi:membrane-associated protease RseP (regulator of RpoE activity)
MVSALALLIAFAALLTTIHLTGMAVTGAFLGATPTVFKLFLGPTLLRKRIGSVRYELGALPCGGFLQFRREQDDVDVLLTIHPLKRALVACAGCVLLVVFGLALGGELESFSSAFGQFARGAFAPTTIGASMLIKYLVLLDIAPLRALGVLAMKLAAWNLIPLPSLNGFQLLTSVAAAMTGKKAIEAPAAAVVVGTIVILAFTSSWLVALFCALLP